MSSEQALMIQLDRRIRYVTSVHYWILRSESMSSLPATTFCWSESPLNAAASEGIRRHTNRAALSEPTAWRGALICKLPVLYTLPELLPSALLSGRHPSILFSTSLRKKELNSSSTEKLTKAMMAVEDRWDHTYMTASRHLDLWLFSEEALLKKVQSNPVTCTLEPFRRDTEEEGEEDHYLARLRWWFEEIHRGWSEVSGWKQLSLFATCCSHRHHFFISEIINREDETAAAIWSSDCGWCTACVRQQLFSFFSLQSEQPACTSSLRKRLNPAGRIKRVKVESRERQESAVWGWSKCGDGIDSSSAYPVRILRETLPELIDQS